MEDPACAWPAWKFGMKRDDLFTTLHEQYNTLSYTLQDPEAFHHDVYEISHDADTVDEFHRMMADRREMRLRELHESLETLAVEIIANPKLMATEQWAHAVQLFRTKSYDSIVRYFASYLPDNYLDRHDAHSVTTTISSPSSYSESDVFSTPASCEHECPFLLTDDDYYPQGPVMTCEPDVIKDEGGQEPEPHSSEPISSPPPETAHSDTSASSPLSNADSIGASTTSPSRSMSFCVCSEDGHVVPDLIHQSYIETRCEEVEFYDDFSASVCDAYTSCSMAERNQDELPQHDEREAVAGFVEFENEDFPTTQYPDDDFFDGVEFVPASCSQDTPDFDTHTSGPQAHTVSHLKFLYSQSKKTPSPRHRSRSPRSALDSSRGAGTLLRQVRRSWDEVSGRIHKPGQDLAKKANKKRRRAAAKKE
ncbi:hypothetical protein E4U42_006739 [Claviceps africana]|uniref:Uncharacterized protein n=1 Tax=Claviceps africana TaxID=83212 RepID=A0A8K0NGJ0_9HYPO|nr:hypothetical protein E4U42_006739 [Claviceps africana]